MNRKCPEDKNPSDKNPSDKNPSDKNPSDKNPSETSPRRGALLSPSGVGFVVVSLVVALSAAAAEPSTGSTDTFSSRLLTITDVVLANHIDPPARQQMILSGAHALYRSEKRTSPKGLASAISELTNRQQLADYLTTLGSEFSGVENSEAVFTQGMLRAVRGAAAVIEAETNRINAQIAANRYVGIGIVLSTNAAEELPAIPKVLYGGPAWKTGVQDGDLILQIDGQPMKGVKLKLVVDALRGAEGSEVTLVVRQPSQQETRTLTMSRGRVFIPTLRGRQQDAEGKWDFGVKGADDIALIEVTRIGPSTLHELRQIEAQLRLGSVRGVIFDLRSGGGTLHDIIMIADSLLDGGTIGHVRSLDSTREHEARPGAIFTDVPIAVLVGEQTASGHVFLAAALQDNGRAVIVGQPTGGETYVNSIVEIPGRQERIRLAVGVMQRADGTPLLGRTSVSPLVRLQGPKKQVGFIQPDVIVRQDRPTRNAAQDKTVAKAAELLRQRGSVSTAI